MHPTLAVQLAAPAPHPHGHAGRSDEAGAQDDSFRREFTAHDRPHRPHTPPEVDGADRPRARKPHRRQEEADTLDSPAPQGADHRARAEPVLDRPHDGAHAQRNSGEVDAARVSDARAASSHPMQEPGKNRTEAPLPPQHPEPSVASDKAPEPEVAAFLAEMESSPEEVRMFFAAQRNLHGGATAEGRAQAQPTGPLPAAAQPDPPGAQAQAGLDKISNETQTPNPEPAELSPDTLDTSANDIRMPEGVLRAIAGQPDARPKSALLRSEFSHAAAILQLRSADQPVDSAPDATPALAASPVLMASTAQPLPMSAGALQSGSASPTPPGPEVAMEPPKTAAAPLEEGPSPPVPAGKIPEGSAVAAPASDTAVIPAPLPAAATANVAATVMEPLRSGPAASPLPLAFQAIVSAIQMQAQEPSSGPTQGRVELILNPAELGRIRFALSGNGDHLKVTIAADNAQTLTLLQRHVGDLRAELAAEGLGMADLNFAGWGAQPDPGKGGASAFLMTNEPAADDDSTVSPLPPSPPQHPLPGPSTGLDLRL